LTTTFSSGSYTEGRIAAKAAVRYVVDLDGDPPQLDEAEVRRLEETIFRPLENYTVGRNEIVTGTVSTSYISPFAGPAAAGEDHGRVRGRHQHLLCDQ